MEFYPIIEVWETKRISMEQSLCKKLIKQIKYLEDQELSILSIYPLLPSYPWPERWNVDFYIDATISQIIDEYKVSNKISNSYKK